MTRPTVQRRVAGAYSSCAGLSGAGSWAGSPTGAVRDRSGEIPTAGHGAGLCPGCLALGGGPRGWGRPGARSPCSYTPRRHGSGTRKAVAWPHSGGLCLGWSHSGEHIMEGTRVGLWVGELTTGHQQWVLGKDALGSSWARLRAQYAPAPGLHTLRRAEAPVHSCTVGPSQQQTPQGLQCPLGWKCMAHCRGSTCPAPPTRLGRMGSPT
jgi:hypothetical protein